MKLVVPSFPKRVLFSAIVSSVVGANVFAQAAQTVQAAQSSQAEAVAPVYVTATRSPTASDALVSDVVLITPLMLSHAQGLSLAQVLQQEAGVQVASSGGAGQPSSVFIRGASSGQVLFLVDGVRYGSATLGTPIWETIPIAMIDHIEVLKGAGSALYGADAAGGVVQVFLKQGVSGFSPSVSSTIGSEWLRSVSAQLAGGEGNFTYALGATDRSQRGISATNANALWGIYNPDRDAFTQNAFNASASWRFLPLWTVSASLLHSEAVVHYDDGPQNDAARASLRSNVQSFALNGTPLPGYPWTTRLSYGRSEDTDNAIAGAYLPSNFSTTQQALSWQNWVNTSFGKLLLGRERLQQNVDASTAYTIRSRSINGVFAGLTGQAAGFNWQANVRRDRNSQFGDYSTGFVGLGYRINPMWKLRADYGNSFVAPSFNQLYYPNYGNPNLLPQQGKNREFAVDWTLGDQQVSLIRYDNRIRDYITDTTIAANISVARMDGWTLSYDGHWQQLHARASLDISDPRDANGDQLARRAKTQANINLDYRIGPWTPGLRALYTGRRFDDQANTLVLKAYTKLDFYVNYAVNKSWSLEARLNNIGNVHYETAYGYNQPGREVFLTLKWAPKSL